MRDADSHRARITDQLMRGETVAKVRLNDVLEGDLILGDELAFVLSPIRWPDRLQRLEDLERKARKCVERFVNQHMDEEVRERIAADREQYAEVDPVAWEMRVTGSSY